MKNDKCEAMKKLSIVKVSLVREGTLPYNGSANDAKNAADITRKFLDQADREHLIALMLNVKLHVDAIHTISIGSLSSSVASPREVFKAAILANASGIILGHNHISGDVTPSHEDILITRRLREAGEIIGINLVDHIIIGDADSYYSFSDSGIM